MRWNERLDQIKPVVTVAALSRALRPQIRNDWLFLVRHQKVAIGQIKTEPAVADALIRLTLMADAASVGIGISTEATPFLSTAQQILLSNDQQSFAWDVPRDAVCVLGKQHTPQRGATFRSLSHHLSLYWPNDIEGRWIGPYDRGQIDKPDDTVNLLLLPWPSVVDTDDFRISVRGRQQPQGKGPQYFEYHPQRPGTLASFRRRFSNAIAAAQRHAKRIDAVILPEMALSIDEYQEAEALAIEAKAMLIGGVRIAASRRAPGSNVCVLQPTGLLLAEEGRRATSKQLQERVTENVRCIQSKHHRWCLDAEQILQYQLAGRLPPSDAIWEDIELPPRKLHFVTLGRWMTWSVLICEDLARQDPAADLIRSVGPNLLITLLMDGPQLRGRWPGRYASVLAEDPGTSVLTLTSLGMAERSRPPMKTTGRRADKSRSVALWRDVELGEQEISLDAGDDACILTLLCKSRQEVSADGRGDGNQAHFPVFAGYKSFATGR